MNLTPHHMHISHHNASSLTELVPLNFMQGVKSSSSCVFCGVKADDSRQQQGSRILKTCQRIDLCIVAGRSTLFNQSQALELIIDYKSNCLVSNPFFELLSFFCFFSFATLLREIFACICLHYVFFLF